jgi:hypothetical protein
MIRKDKIELIAIVTCLLCAVAMCFYNLSSDGFLGLSTKKWNLIWAISENVFPIFLCIGLSFYFEGVIQFLLRWLFVLYFAIRLIYHISCYCNIYMFSPKAWNIIWGIELVLLILSGLFVSIILMIKEKK